VTNEARTGHWIGQTAIIILAGAGSFPGYLAQSVARTPIPKLFFFGVILLCGGCALSRNPYQPVAYYDIRPEAPEQKPGSAPLALTLQVRRFDMLGPYRTRMVYRKSEHRLVQDEYNRWIQPPEQLIEREFYRVLSASGRFRRVVTHMGAEADLMLSGTVLRLETGPDLTAHVQLSLRLEEPGEGNVVLSKQYEVMQPLRDQTPEGFADAVSLALEKIFAGALEDIAEAAQAEM